ncbi:hypothetical protein [Allochromatium tepidum]|uniref:Uncharacterized protein n=1 Tax=Allochromatium tepidum TaxID=553982 RepID=A0ABM7QN24_9GAMM|nr:hypothetical protein [Allochromatium tepidum]BCU07228.1 hypothetical protein Atep_19050 [Allochromatium tepidum]
MSEARFDILFDGSLKPDADPRLARERLGAAFKLDAAGVERLFAGKPVAVKRDADLTTAARYKRVFEEAGAIVTLRALDAVEPAAPPQAPAAAPPSPTVSPPTDRAPAAAPEPVVERAASEPMSEAGAEMDAKADTAGGVTTNLTAEGGFEFLEEPPKVKMPDLDLSHLSLVGGSDWSLADCEQTPEPVRIPDISHLRLDEIEPPPDDNDPTGQNPPP